MKNEFEIVTDAAAAACAGPAAAAACASARRRGWSGWRRATAAVDLVELFLECALHQQLGDVDGPGGAHAVGARDQLVLDCWVPHLACSRQEQRS